MLFFFWGWDVWFDRKYWGCFLWYLFGMLFYGRFLFLVLFWGWFFFCRIFLIDWPQTKIWPWVVEQNLFCITSSISFFVTPQEKEWQCVLFFKNCTAKKESETSAPLKFSNLRSHLLRMAVFAKINLASFHNKWTNPEHGRGITPIDWPFQGWKDTPFNPCQFAYCPKKVQEIKVLWVYHA